MATNPNAVIFIAKITAAESRREVLRNVDSGAGKAEKRAINKMLNGAQNEIARSGSEFLAMNGFTWNGLKPKSRK